MQALLQGVLCLALAGCASLQPGSTSGFVLQHDGLKRAYSVHVPTGYKPDVAAPLVIMLHGGFGSGSQLEKSSRMSTISDREGFLVAYPDGTGRLAPTWNAGACCGGARNGSVDDEGFILAMVDDAAKMLNVDRRRIYLSGMSNGAMMSYRLACAHPDVFAAIAPVAGGLEMDTCAAAHAVPVMHVSGTRDARIPVEGKRACGFDDHEPRTILDTMKVMRAANQCTNDVLQQLSSEGGVTCERQGEGCQADLILCLVDGGGHDWPGGTPTARWVNLSCREDGPQNTTWDASDHIWEFLKTHQLPAR